MAGAHFTIQTDHDSLKNLPNQPAVNRRVWKWVQVLQGYDCDIVHISGKSNPADFLSRRSVKELRSRGGQIARVRAVPHPRFEIAVRAVPQPHGRRPHRTASAKKFCDSAVFRMIFHVFRAFSTFSA